MFRQFNIKGTWLSGPHSGRSGQLVDFRAGLLVVASGADELIGSPDHFCADDGSSGQHLLRRLMQPPTTEDLRYGAIREAIVAAHSVALFGFSETRAWESSNQYIVDTGEGSAAVVRFDAAECFGAAVSIDPSRFYSAIAELKNAPAATRAMAQSVLSLPFLADGSMAPVTAIFWSEGEKITGNEPWHKIYEFGAEVLRNELLSDTSWGKVAAAYYNVNSAFLSEVMRIASNHRVCGGQIALDVSEYDRLVPPGASYAKEAVELLSSAGISRRG